MLSLAEVRIAVVDSGLYTGHKKDVKICDGGKAVFNSLSLDSNIWNDTITHGDSILFTIKDELKIKDYCFIVIKTFDSKHGPTSIAQLTMALLAASTFTPEFVNLSYSGIGGDILEKSAIIQLAHSGLEPTISVAAGNDGVDLNERCKAFPACYKVGKNFHVVGSYDPEHPNKILKKVNYGDAVVTDNADECSVSGGVLQCGTSQSTAYVTARLVNQSIKKNKQKEEIHGSFTSTRDN